METATAVTAEQIRAAKDILCRADNESHPDMEGFWESRAGDKDAKAYWSDVRDMVGSIEAEFREEMAREKWTKDAENDAREWLNDHLHESVDGCARVIYTHQAKLCLVHSEHEGRYFEEVGVDGAVDGDCINWSALAFMAFEGDVMDRLDFDDLLAELPDAPEDEDEDNEDESEDSEA